MNCRFQDLRFQKTAKRRDKRGNGDRGREYHLTSYSDNGKVWDVQFAKGSAAGRSDYFTAASAVALRAVADESAGICCAKDATKVGPWGAYIRFCETNPNYSARKTGVKCLLGK